MMAETGQLEMEAIPDSELGKSCKRYLAVKDQIKDMEQESRDISKEILGFLEKEGRTSIRFSGWEFETDAPDLRLLCHPIKGRANSEKNAA